jgi:hypothetical protein
VSYRSNIQGLALAHVLVYEALDSDLLIDVRVGLSTLPEPLLQCHDLVETVYVLVEFVQRGSHKPLYLLLSEQPHDIHHDRDPDQDHYYMSTHLVQLHQEPI